MILLDQTIAITLFHTTYFVFLIMFQVNLSIRFLNYITQKISTAVIMSERLWSRFRCLILHLSLHNLEFSFQILLLGAYLSYVEM
jgi:hypothetical protein